MRRGRVAIVLLALLVGGAVVTVRPVRERAADTPPANAWLRIVARHAVELAPPLAVFAEGRTVWVGPALETGAGFTSRDGGRTFATIPESAPPGLQASTRRARRGDADGVWQSPWPHAPWRTWTFAWEEPVRVTPPLTVIDPFGSALVIAVESRPTGAALVLRRFLPTAATLSPRFGLVLELPLSDVTAVPAAAASGSGVVIAWHDAGRTHVARVEVTEALCASPRFSLPPPSDDGRR